MTSSTTRPAVQSYVWSTSLIGSMGLWKALERDLGIAPGELALAIFDHRMKPQHVVMTAKSEVVYTWSQYINVSKTGPMVVEVPAGVRGHFWEWLRLFNTGQQEPAKVDATTDPGA